MTNLEAMEPVDDQVDHVRGPAGGRLILEYGDYECPYSRRAFLERVEQRLSGGVRFAFRHSSGLAWGEVRGTPTLFLDGVVHLGDYDAATLVEAMSR